MHVTLVQGGGAGFDQVPAVQRILKEAGVAVEWDEHLAGIPALEQGREPLPKEMFASIKANGLALKTKILSPAGKEANFNVQFRQKLDLFASVRPLRNLPGLPARFQGVDFVVIRELTEDLYAAGEHEIVPGVVQSIKVVTEAACKRFFKFALDWTRQAGRKQVTCVHKANILKMADGLFLETFRQTAKDYPDIQTRDFIVDNCCMQMVLKPQQFDVLVMGNLYGDLVSDLGAGIVGGISATSGHNVGHGVHIYETFHGGPREAVGIDRANPLPLLLPAIDLAEHLGKKEAAAHIRAAIATVMQAGNVRTPDLGGTATTTQMANALIDALHAAN
jgi:isocitrate dehydrogenase (NAD+)